MGRKAPIFGSRDQEKIKAKQDNGGISENTKKRRAGVNKVFDQGQEINARPTLKELCENRDKDGLEKDLQGFFESYYVDLDKDDLVAEDLDEDDLEEQAANENQEDIENPDELEVQDASKDSKK